MTKFILHGGETSRLSLQNDIFFKEMLVSYDKPKILCVYFARKAEDWSKLFSQDHERFSLINSKRNLEISLASNDEYEFEQQFRSSNVIYIRGGDTSLLMKAIQPHAKYFISSEGKIISGSSAGACVLARYYCTGSEDSEIEEGLGVLPIKIMVHFAQNNRSKLCKLENTGTCLPTFSLAEEQFVTLMM